MGPGRILIVDDDPSTCRALARHLRRSEFVCELVHTAEAAAEAVEQNNYEMILLDWGLPDKPGTWVLQRTRAVGVTCPVMMITGRKDVGSKVEAFLLGADDYLMKPFDADELVARVQAMLRRAHAPSEPLRVGTILLNQANLTVTVDGEYLDLTAIEFRLLWLLAHNANRAVPRQELASFAAGSGGAPLNFKSLDVHLVRMRRKLGTAGDQLKTLRGAGILLTAAEIDPESSGTPNPTKM